MPKPQLIGHAIPPDSQIFVDGTGSCRNRFGVGSALRASPDHSLRSLDEIYWAIKAIFHKLDCSEKDQHQVDHEELFDVFECVYGHFLVFLSDAIKHQRTESSIKLKFLHYLIAHD